ncbi:MAG: phytanoyl-CoA dioxygenase family protein [bacterium]
MITPLPTQPSSAGKAHFDREGYAIFRKVLEAGLVEEARQHVDWLLQKNPDTRPEQLHHFLMTDDPFWVRLISDDRLLDVAEQFIGPNIALFASHYICKRPYDGQAVLWHQDGTYWPLEPMAVVTLWLAIDNADAENGCMRVLPRTQHLLLLAPEELITRNDDNNVLGSGIDPAQIDETQAVDIVLQAGDVSVHHPNVIHGSNANTSARWRRGLTIRYIPSTTRILTEKIFPSAFMLRGRAEEGVNEYNRWPQYVEGRHMPFKDWREWNQTCARKNQEVREVS